MMQDDKNSSSTGRLPCCQLMRTLSQDLNALAEPARVRKALEIMQDHCRLMALVGKKKTAWDLSRQACFIADFPDVCEGIIQDIAKTVAVFAELGQFEGLLFHLQAMLAHSAQRQQIEDRHLIFLKALREREKKWGAVPDTPLTREKNAPSLGLGDALKAHPLLNKPQMDGLPPKDTANPVLNPEAAENKQALENKLEYQKRLQLQQQLAATPGATAPKIRPGG